MERRVGTAAWGLPKDVRAAFPGEGTLLERYARRFSCVEINSSFYRPHRRQTYERWAATVPEAFRFALKIPKEITHERRLIDAGAALERFLAESAGLAGKRDVLLVQLPPSLAYAAPLADRFFALLRTRYPGRAACEPRHASWFAPEPDALLRAHRIARVAADPPAGTGRCEPGGSPDFQYWRLHGAPRIYYSAYSEPALDELAATLASAPVPVWCIFDNTASGAATANALHLTAAITRA